MPGFFAQGVVKPHHAMTPDGVVLGYSHLGMLAAARWLMARTKDTLITALQQHPGYQLRAVGGFRAVAVRKELTCFVVVAVAWHGSCVRFHACAPAAGGRFPVHAVATVLPLWQCRH